MEARHFTRLMRKGIRVNREYSDHPPSKITRITTYGDSFTHGDHVFNDETWQYRLEKTIEDLEVLNLGVPGYGLDQAYLHYKQSNENFDPHIVLIGIMSRNIFRHVNTFRLFVYSATRMPMTKPRFILKKGRLDLLPNQFGQRKDYEKLLLDEENTLLNIGKNDFFFNRTYHQGRYDFLPSVRLYKIGVQHLLDRFSLSNAIVKEKYFNVDSEAFKITTELFEEFHASVLSHSSIPIIIIFPSKIDMAVYYKHKIQRYKFLLEYFKEKGFKTIDIMDAFLNYPEQLSPKDLFNKSQHYTSLGNKIVAQYLASYLKEYVHEKSTDIHSKLLNKKNE